MHTYFDQLDPTYFICTIYIAGYKYNTNISNGEMYKDFPYDIMGMKIADFAGELNIPLFLKISWTVSVMQTNSYNQHAMLHKYQKMPSSDCMVMHTDNSNIKAHFWIVIPLLMQQVVLQLQLLICNT